MKAEEYFINKHYAMDNGMLPFSLVMELMDEFAQQQSIDFAKFIGDRPIPEYSKSTDKWRWWDNNDREYKYSTTNELLTEWVNLL